MAQSARLLSTNELQKLVNQTAHGFTVGEVLRFNGANYVGAQANSVTNSQVVGMVSAVSDVNSFFISQAGYLNNIPGGVGLVAGTRFYLSPTTPGAITSTAPTADTQIILPIFDADSTTTGYFFNDIGVLINAGGGGLFTWSVATINTSMGINKGYIINGAGALTMTLPNAASPGDIVEIAGYSASGWSIAQNAGQTIHFIGMNTTAGAGGSLSSNTRYDTIKLINVVATTDWLVIASEGNITVV